MSYRYDESEDNWIELGDLVDKARQCYRDKNYSEAIELYREILDHKELHYNQRANVLAELGYCYYYVGNYDLAAKTLKSVMELDENYTGRSSIYRILGASYFGLQNYSKALEYRKLSFSLSRDKQERNCLMFELGRSYLFAEDGRSAKKFLMKYLRALPDSVSDEKMDAMYNLGFAYMQLDKPKEAQKSFGFLIEHQRKKEDLARGYYGLAELFYHMRKFDKVKDLTQKILDIYDQFSERETILFYRIVAYLEQGDEPTAAELAQSFATEYPDTEHIEAIRHLL